ncbi:serine/arginine repetitive matrix protein 2-like isoform X2 [Artemia franciscana]|uniref:serine/arginine repetitive matrix protein 2-like isoform X2 n=1 Tax=Artemia franciscana TaxID=6661 RepID=UPI0032DB02D7
MSSTSVNLFCENLLKSVFIEHQESQLRILARFEQIFEMMKCGDFQISKRRRKRRKRLKQRRNRALKSLESNSVRDTHEVAAATQERNIKLRQAFGVSSDFVEGSSFDPNRKAKAILKQQEEKAKEMAEKNNRFGLVRSPTPEEPEAIPPSPKRKQKKDKKAKSRKHRRHDSSSDDISDIDRSDEERREKRKKKKHDKERRRYEIIEDNRTKVTKDTDEALVSLKDAGKLPLSPPRSSRSPTPQKRSRSPSRLSSRRSNHSSSRSRSRSYSSRSCSRSRSRSRSRSHSYSRSRSRSYSRSRSRSPSIPRRAGSPSFLDRRRITSARKRPIPYHRPTPSPYTSDSETDYSRYRLSLSRSRSRSTSSERSKSSRRSYTPSNHIFASKKVKIWRGNSRTPSLSPKRSFKKGGRKRSPAYN